MSFAQEGFRWWLLIPASIVLIFLFFQLHSMHAMPPTTDVGELNPQWYSIETARGEIRQSQPIVGNCFICHAFWVPIPRSTENSSTRFSHANIQLNHGKNDRCYNCHHVTDRNMYVADNGSPLFFNTPELLCGRCHGIIFNDWLKGTHGKWTGSFIKEIGEGKNSYTCTECHDPHSPVYHYSVLAPAPTWPSKYIRGESHLSEDKVFSGFVSTEEPKEMF